MAVEEKKLRIASKNINTYLNFALADRAGKAKHHFIKDTETIEKIAILLMRESNYRIPVIDIDAEFKNRPLLI